MSHTATLRSVSISAGKGNDSSQPVQDSEDDDFGHDKTEEMELSILTENCNTNLENSVPRIPIAL